MIIILAHFALPEYKNSAERKELATLRVLSARYLTVLNHITRVPFLPLLALSPAGSFLFYLFRLSTAVLEARRDFAAIYFMRVTSFSALSLPPAVPRTYPRHLFPKTHPRDVLMELDSVRHTHACARARSLLCSCTCRPYSDVFISIAKAAPSVLFCTYFALIHPSRPLTPPTTVYRTG